MSYALSIGSIPQSGYLGDQFRFVGILTVNGGIMPGVVVQLIREYEVVGEAVTQANGNYDIYWVADRTGVIAFRARATGLFVYSPTITVDVLDPTQDVVKVGEMEIHYFKLLGASDATIMNLCSNKATEVLDGYVMGAYAANPRLVKASGVFQKCVLDVYEPVEAMRLGSVVLFDPATIALIIGAVLIAIGVTWVICYNVKYMPAAQALSEIGKTLAVVKTELDQALEQGKIDPDVYNSVIDKIDKAAEKAEEYGEDPEENWFKYLETIFNWIQWIIMGGIAIVVLPRILDLFPRARRG